MDKLLKLAERCEKSTGDHKVELVELEMAIREAIGKTDDDGERAFVNSLDAAMTLVPEGVDCSLWWGTRGGKVTATMELDGGANSLAATPALALCAAALRARTIQGSSTDANDDA